METSPVPPEWVGTPKVMFITDTPITMSHDFEQTPLIGVTRLRLIQLIEKYINEWYITPLIKCSPNGDRYLVKDYKACTEWINEEIRRVQPKVVVACGKSVSKYIKCNYETMGAARIVQGKKNELEFEKLMEKIKKDLDASKFL